MSYSSFKRAVFRAAQGMCECPGHDHPAETVHHFFKQSTHPEMAEDPDNGMAIAGACHTELERRLREGLDWRELVPMFRYLKAAMKTKFGSGL